MAMKLKAKLSPSQRAVSYRESAASRICRRHAKLLRGFCAQEQHRYLPFEHVVLVLKLCVHSRALEAELPQRWPQMWLCPECDVHKQIAQFDACPKATPHLQNAIAASKPTEDRSLVRQLPSADDEADAQENGMRLGGDAMCFDVKHRVHTSTSRLRFHSERAPRV